MPLNVQDLLDELDPIERKKVDELTAQLRAEHDAYHRRPAPSAASDSVSTPPLATSRSEHR
ncbi:MAG: hypothetical protein OXE76_10480 [Alphaproteobacteria bacterium]|nr:hypothetical protein [Alphaproteobacteria bacterium]